MYICRTNIKYTLSAIFVSLVRGEVYYLNPTDAKVFILSIQTNFLNRYFVYVYTF